MPRRRLASHRRRAEELSDAQFWELLLCGYYEERSAFESEQDARDAWMVHGAGILAELGTGNGTPAALDKFGYPATSGPHRRRVT